MSSSDSDLESGMAGMSKSLPTKSKMKYLQAYETFVTWKKKNQKDSLDEGVFLDYFRELADKRKPTSLWSIFSMLKCTMRVKHNIYIQNYTNLTWFLKKQSRGYKCVVSKILTEENIKKFIRDAPDEVYLSIKVALIFGICGACRSGELVKLTTKDIKKHGDVFVVTISDSPNNGDRVFVIQEELTPIVEKYTLLRPKKVETDRFFLKYKDGKCIRQVIGLNKFSSMPRTIATFLQLPNPKSYTAHCFRRSATGYSGANVVGYRRKRSKVVPDREDDDFTIDVQQKQKINETTNGKPKKQKDDADTDDEYIPEESNQDIEVLIEDNKTPVVKSLRDVRAHSFRPSALKELEMEFDKDSDDVSEDPISIKTEDVDETIDLRPQSDFRIQQPSVSNEKLHVSSDENHTNIRIAGKNINIIFKNCAKVGNVTINIIKD